jgi:uncharacterized protein
MSPEVAMKALDLAAASGLSFHVQMAGGEPTLEPELMEAVGRRVRESGWSATMAVQTNGTRIDDRLITLCRRYNISVGISLDGPPSVQEHVRGNAAATFRALGLLAQADWPVHITTVLSAANVMELGRLVLVLASFANVRGIGLDPVILKGNALEQHAIYPSRRALQAGICSMWNTLSDINRLRVSPIRWRELDLVIGAMNGDKKAGGYCHACRGESLAVHPDGIVYPCGQTVADPDMKAGTVDCVDWERLRAAFQDVRLRGDCGECSLRENCPGDCPSRIHYNEKNRSDAIMCTIYRSIAAGLQNGFDKSSLAKRTNP